MDISRGGLGRGKSVTRLVEKVGEKFRVGDSKEMIMASVSPEKKGKAGEIYRRFMDLYDVDRQKCARIIAATNGKNPKDYVRDDMEPILARDIFLYRGETPPDNPKDLRKAARVPGFYDLSKKVVSSS